MAGCCLTLPPVIFESVGKAWGKSIFPSKPPTVFVGHNWTVLHKNMTDGWTPDTEIAHDVIDGSRSWSGLGTDDRAVVVAELTFAGESVDLIASRLSCSAWAVERTLAEPLTASLIRAHRAERELSEWKERAGRPDTGEADRLRAQRDALTAALHDTRRPAAETADGAEGLTVIEPRRRRRR